MTARFAVRSCERIKAARQRETRHRPCLGPKRTARQAEMTAMCLRITAVLLAMSRFSSAQFLNGNQDADCSLLQLTPKLTAVKKTCCSSAGAKCVGAGMPAKCSMQCALAFVPFYRSCMHTIDSLFDTADGKKDARASIFFDFEAKCSSMPTAPLFAKIEDLLANSCVVNTASIMTGGSTMPPANCKDNDARVKAFVGLTCAQVKKSQMCDMIKLLPVGDAAGVCACSCPTGAQVGALVNKGGSGCTSSSPCGQCEGDCDTDKDCDGSMKCFQRQSSLTQVPGCSKGGVGDVATHDYCYAAPRKSLGGWTQVRTRSSPPLRCPHIDGTKWGHAKNCPKYATGKLCAADCDKIAGCNALNFNEKGCCFKSCPDVSKPGPWYPTGKGYDVWIRENGRLVNNGGTGCTAGHKCQQCEGKLQKVAEIH